LPEDKWIVDAYLATVGSRKAPATYLTNAAFGYDTFETDTPCELDPPLEVRLVPNPFLIALTDSGLVVAHN
jgi:hypothetical protein